MKKLCTLLLVTGLMLVSFPSSAIWIVIIKCNKCGVVKHAEFGNLLIRDVCRGKGVVDCHMTTQIQPNAGGISVDLSGQIAAADPIERMLLEQVQAKINSGSTSGKIIHDQQQISAPELAGLFRRIETMLELSETNPQALEAMADKNHFAAWRVESDGSVDHR